MYQYHHCKVTVHQHTSSGFNTENLATCQEMRVRLYFLPWLKVLCDSRNNFILFCKIYIAYIDLSSQVHVIVFSNTFLCIGWIGANLITFETNSSEVMFEYLQTLARVNWLNQLQSEIQNISLNDPNMTKELGQMFKASANATKDDLTREIAEMFLGPIDDFKELFENQLNNILHCLFLIFAQVFSTAFFMFLIHYEKFGKDPMKRSLSNQLFAQFGWIAILDNWFIRPVWIYRILIGPVNQQIALICSLILKAVLGTWYVSLCKNSLLTKIFSY